MTEIPVRFSSNGEFGLPFDRSLSPRLRVFVGGDFLRGIVAYDIEAGWVEVLEHDERGHATKRDGQWLTRRVHGRVDISIVSVEGPKQ